MRDFLESAWDWMVWAEAFLLALGFCQALLFAWVVGKAIDWMLQ